MFSRKILHSLANAKRTTRKQTTNAGMTMSSPSPSLEAKGCERKAATMADPANATRESLRRAIEFRMGRQVCHPPTTHVYINMKCTALEVLLDEPSRNQAWKCQVSPGDGRSTLGSEGM